MTQADRPTRQSPVPNLVVAISSRALFDLDESNRVFEEEGVEAYRRYQIAREDQILAPGDAFELVRKLLSLNASLPEGRVEVILLSRNTADTGLRIFRSIEHHGLDISRAAFCGGSSPYRYVGAFGCQLLLSTELADIELALADNLAAARILPGSAQRGASDDELRIAFDGDAVLFDPEAERVFQQQGLHAFAASEAAKKHQPLAGGPFKPFLSALHGLQQQFPATACPIRTALVTARSAPAHERVIRTLREWGIRLDESLFLGGLPKGPFLKSFGADVFFDDQLSNVTSAADHVTTAHVPHPGVSPTGGTGTPLVVGDAPD